MKWTKLILRNLWLMLFLLANTANGQIRAILSLSYDECSACYDCPIKTIDYLRSLDSTIKIDLLLPDTSSYTREFLLNKYIGEENLDFYVSQVLNRIYADTILFDSLNASPRTHISLFQERELLLNIPILLFFNGKDSTYIHFFSKNKKIIPDSNSMKINTLFRATLSRKYSAITNKLIHASNERIIAFNSENSKDKLLLINQDSVVPLNIDYVLYNKILKRLKKPTINEKQFEVLNKALRKKRAMIIDISCVGNVGINGKFPIVGWLSFLEGGVLIDSMLLALVDTNLKLDTEYINLIENRVKIPDSDRNFYLNCSGVGVFDQGLYYDSDKNIIHLKGYDPEYLKQTYDSFSNNYFPVSYTVKISKTEKQASLIKFDEPLLPKERLKEGWGYFNNSVFYEQLHNGNKYILFENQNAGYLYNLEKYSDSIAVIKNPIEGYIYELASVDHSIHILYSKDKVVSNHVYYSVTSVIESDGENDQNQIDFRIPISDITNPTFKITPRGIYILSIDLKRKNENAVVYRLNFRNK